MAPCIHPGIKSFCAYRQKTASVASLSRPWLITSRWVNEARWPHTCGRPCAFEEQQNRRRKTRKSPAAPKIHHKTHAAARQPRPRRDSARRNTSHALTHTRPLLWNQPCTALAISINDECYKYTDRQTDRQTNYIMRPCTHRGMKRLFCQ